MLASPLKGECHMTMAGNWQQTSGAFRVDIDGSEPTYSFQTIARGVVVAQGTVTAEGPGSYWAHGVGLGGPVKMHLQLQGPNQVLLSAFLATGNPLFDQFLTAVAEHHILQRPQPVVTSYEPQPVPRQVSQEPAKEPPREEPVHRPRKSTAPPRANTKKQTGDPLGALEELVGMTEVKDQLRRLDAWAWRQRELRNSGVEVEPPSLHMCFAGNPGTGKTTVAKMVGQLLHQYGLLEREDVTEKGRADLVAKFVGQTSDQTKKVIEEAMGGVLFIDEAYALSQASKGASADYGPEALAVLIAEMENRRSELCVIVAGYPQEKEDFLDTNAGLASRISRRVTFADYTSAELCLVFDHMVKSRNLTRDDQILPMLRSYTERVPQELPPRRWGNARSIRNILEAGIENQAVRLRAKKQTSKEDLLRLAAADFEFLRAPKPSVY
jgi:stage V sporulation protein K